MKDQRVRSVFWIAITLLVHGALEFLGAHIPSSVSKIGEHVAITISIILIIHLLDSVRFRKEDEDRIRSAVRSAITTDLKIASASERIGISAIFERRSAALPTIIKAIESADSRVWIQGVSLSNVFDVHTDHVFNLIVKKSKSCSVRILMLDPLRSTAVFRTLLESTTDDAKRVLESHRQESCPTASPILSTPMMRCIDQTLSRFHNNGNIEALLRFYGHTPSGWLVIVDKQAFFQPYTFGNCASDADASSRLLVGDRMPLTVFGGDSLPCQPLTVLSDHFDKTWRTSDCDVLRMKHRASNKNSAIHQIFEKRRDWLSHVVEELASSKRNEIRRMCSTHSRVEAQLPGRKQATTIEVEVRDFSLTGLGFVVTRGSPPSKGSVITIGRHLRDSAEEPEKIMNDRFFRKASNKWVFRKSCG